METLQELKAINKQEREIEMWKIYFNSELNRKDIIGDINCSVILDDIQSEIDCGKFWMKRLHEDLTSEYEYRNK